MKTFITSESAGGLSKMGRLVLDAQVTLCTSLRGFLFYKHSGLNFNAHRRIIEGLASAARLPLQEAILEDSAEVESFVTTASGISIQNQTSVYQMDWASGADSLF
jgi:hypothetical protein